MPASTFGEKASPDGETKSERKGDEQGGRDRAESEREARLGCRMCGIRRPILGIGTGICFSTRDVVCNQKRGPLARAKLQRGVSTRIIRAANVQNCLCGRSFTE